MIVRRICSRKKTERICGQEFPREVIKSALLKVDRICLENAIEQIKQTDNVRNYERYLISTLFNEANGRSFKENAETRSVDFAVKRNASAHAVFNNFFIEYRERARLSRTHRADVSIRNGTDVICRTAAENFSFRIKLNVNLKPDHCCKFQSHQRSMRVAAPYCTCASAIRDPSANTKFGRSSASGFTTKSRSSVRG